MQRSTLILKSILVLLMLVSTAAFGLQKKHDDQDKKEAQKEQRENAADLPAVIWRDPGDISTLNLVYGAGGAEHAPDPNGTYTFDKEDMEGTSPKFDVKDGNGTKWRIKLGQEPQAETAATRLLWAAGYFVEEDYYVAELKVQNLPKLHRGQEFVTADGTAVRGARLKRKSKDVKKLGDWSW